MSRISRAKVKGFLALVGVFGVVTLGLYLSYRWNGLVNTIVYAVVLVMCASIIPLSISLFGAAMPGSTSLGKAHIVLGSFAFNEHYLVQREDRWESCPGEEDRVYIDGEWHDISALEHKSVLGWRPFGILRYKDDGTLSDVRADDAAREQRQGATADGGVVELEDDGSIDRGGWQQAARPTVTGRGSRWLVDLKRLYSSGIKKIGDIELIETAEEIIERGQVNDSTLSGLGPALTFIVALILGMLAGGVVLFLG